MQRRSFIRHIAAGGAILTVPALVAGCAGNQPVVASDSTSENPFYDVFGIDEATIQRVMTELAAIGADVADVYFQYKRSNFITLDNGIVSRADTELLQGVGLRTVKDGQVGYAFTEELTLPSMLAAAKAAAAGANHESGASQASFNASPTGRLYTIEVPWADVSLDQKLPLLNLVDQTCRNADSAVNNVTINWTDVDERVVIATLDGRLVTDHRPMTRLSAQVTAVRGGESQSGFASIAARQDLSWYTPDRIDGLAQDAMDRTLVLFDARRPPTGDMPVILASGGCGVLLHEAIGHGLEADLVRNGNSDYAGMLGEKVASPAVTIVDQATLPNKRGALNYDDEGNECGRSTLIDKGILISYLHDSTSAAAYNVSTTGSARRQSFRFAPMPRMTCTFMENGAHEKEELVAAMDRGIIVNTITGGQVEIGAGDFRFLVKDGWLVENGKITAPVRDFAISGNGPETLQRISMVANDSQFDSGGWTCGKNGQSVPVSQGMPSVLVATMNIDVRQDDEEVNT